MKEMKEISAGAADAFLQQNPKCFVRCFLKNHTCCDMIDNNMVETFSRTIVHSRSKHIIDILEDIRVSIMTRLTKKHTNMLLEDVVVCPRIQIKVDKEKS